MKYPKNRKNNRGVSIIEIVVSMVLIMLVMLVLAFVYPNGRKVTESTDKRTKATEIAKSIMEEIQLIPLLPKAVGAETAGDELFHYSLVNVNGDKTLNDLISNSDLMKRLKWPYHQLSSNGWDAIYDGAAPTSPVCPFFITNNNNAQAGCIANPSRPFFICTDNGTVPIGIDVSPSSDTKLDVTRINQINPIIATVTVNVAWGNNVNGRWHFSYISLVNTRTENIY